MRLRRKAYQEIGPLHGSDPVVLSMTMQADMLYKWAEWIALAMGVASLVQEVWRFLFLARFHRRQARRWRGSQAIFAHQGENIMAWVLLFLYWYLFCQRTLQRRRALATEVRSGDGSNNN